MSKYLLELGVEELPYSLIEPISEQIKENFEKKLEENNAKYSSIKTYTTPRRLVFVIDGLSEVQADIEKTFKGPNAKVAIDAEGNYTQAALGFARKFGADASSLYKFEENGQEYVALSIKEKGKALQEIIPAILSECVLKVQGHHFMRWAGFDEKFSRPIRWIVSILDNKEIPVELLGIKSSKKSRAHRFAAEKFPEITDVASYLEIMLAHNVIVDEKMRKEQIVKSVKELAQSIGAEVKIEEELLKEVTNIVEFPRPVLGNFDEKYLAIPEPVIVTVMASHQRYFPIYDKAGKLMNGFITVANYVGDDFANIKNGNERVIKARLDDAIFFYNEDIKKPLIDRVNDLDGITFQKGLGSMKNKVERIVKISNKIATTLGCENNKNIERTALCCKADLTTSLVFEFTELQGIIGAHYAKVFNENDAVVKGIKEHYYPLVADAELATAIEGQIVGIADKMDTITGVFALNKIPSGSVDPLGVRRAAIGVIQTIVQKKLPLNILDIIEYAISIIGIEVADAKKLKNDIAAFFTQRLKGILGSKYATDHIDAVLSTSSALQDLSSAFTRLELLKSVSSVNDFDKIVASHTRISKLAKGTENGEVKEALFQNQAEKDLYKSVSQLAAKDFVSYEVTYNSLASLIPVIDKFFEDVMVMDKDEAIKNNRLNLLAKANKEFLKVADFTKIIKGA